jgi:hypothetical protein
MAPAISTNDTTFLSGVIVSQADGGVSMQNDISNADDRNHWTHASRMQRGPILSARSPSLPARLQRRLGQLGTSEKPKPIASDPAKAPKSVGNTLRFGGNCFAPPPLVRPMPNTRSPIFVAAGLVLLVAVAAAQPSTTPMKMLDDVRDRRYCELFVVKRQGVRLVADVYNTLGLNDCPQATWDAIDTAKVASQFGAFRVIRNGPRHFIMDRLASGDVTRSPADIQGLAMRPVATMRLRLLDLIEKRAFYVERTIHRTTDWTFLAGKPVYELVSPKGQVYVMQSYSQIVDPSLGYTDLAALGSRLKPPKGWQYRSRTLTADLVAPARGEAHIIQDELQNTYQRLPGP